MVAEVKGRQPANTHGMGADLKGNKKKREKTATFLLVCKK